MKKACPSQERIQLGGWRNMDDTERVPGHLGLPLLARIKVLCIRAGHSHRGRGICSQVALIPPPLPSTVHNKIQIRPLHPGEATESHSFSWTVAGNWWIGTKWGALLKPDVTPGRSEMLRCFCFDISASAEDGGRLRVAAAN